MGKIIDIADVRTLDSAGIDALVTAVMRHGLVILRNQTLSVHEQMELSDRLGDETLILPPSFRTDASELQPPALMRISNAHPNGTWKTDYKFGEGWHQDGDFFAGHNRSVMSILHAVEVPSKGARTVFADLVSACKKLPASLSRRARRAVVTVDPQVIFWGAPEEELALFPRVQYSLWDRHPQTHKEICYPGSVISQISWPEGEANADDGAAFLESFMEHATSSEFVYMHSWQVGDILIWDNMQLLHQKVPDAGKFRRVLHRVQVRLNPVPAEAGTSRPTQNDVKEFGSD